MTDLGGNGLTWRRTNPAAHNDEYIKSRVNKVAAASHVSKRNCLLREPGANIDDSKDYT